MMNSKWQKRNPVRALAATVCVVVMSGCATTGGNPDDPLEGYNRAMFSFNEQVDKAVLRPVAQAYKTVTPTPVRTGVGNVFGNIGDVWIGANNFLQGKVEAGISDWMRFLVNSSFGLLGMLDVASEMGFRKNDEDFGQTLAVWGVGEGPFVVLPLFGPKTLRDAAMMPVDSLGDGVMAINHVPTRNSLLGLRLVDGRARLLGIDKTLDEGTLDKYGFARDFYLQQRRYKVFDGAPPLEYENFDDFDDADAAGEPAAGAAGVGNAD